MQQGNVLTVRRNLFRIAVILLAVVALALVYRALSRYSLDEIVDSVSRIPAGRLAAATGFAASSYLCLTLFDWLALRYAGKPLPWRRAALASFAGLSIGHNVGIAALSSGAIRYRFYSRWGLDGEEVARVILFCGVTVGLGLITVGGAALLLRPQDASGILGLGRGATLALACACLAIPAAYVGLSAILRRPLKVWRWSFGLPTPGLAAAQVAAGALNFALVAACLHQLVAALSEAGYLEVASAYVIGNGTAMASHVPGGLGVLEATVLHLLPGAGAVGAVVAFRVVYFFVPLAFGLPLFLFCEYWFGRQASEQEAADPGKGIGHSVPGRS